MHTSICAISTTFHISFYLLFYHISAFHEHFAILSFWEQSLRHELALPGSVYVLLRRRIPLLIADWRAQVI